MLTFDKGLSFINGGRSKTERKLGNNTTVRILDADTLAVKLHATDVLLIHRDGRYTLNSGGYRTVTTKARINEYGPARVSQVRGVWYVNGAVFADGMVIGPDGDSIPVGAAAAEAGRQALAARIRRYIDGYALSVKGKGLTPPDAGDCLCCQMAAQVADSSPEDHILSHLDEGYYVPSLLVTAIRSRNPAPPQFVWTLLDTEARRGDTRFLKQILRGYFRKILPCLSDGAAALTPAWQGA